MHTCYVCKLFHCHLHRIILFPISASYHSVFNLDKLQIKLTYEKGVNIHFVYEIIFFLCSFHQNILFVILYLILHMYFFYIYILWYIYLYQHQFTESFMAINISLLTHIIHMRKLQSEVV